MEIRDRIIHAALISVSKKRFDKTRMDDIGLESNLSEGTLYIYFASKEDLFYTICEQNLVELRKQLFSLFVTSHERKKPEDQILVSDNIGYYNNFNHFEYSYIIFLKVLSKSTRNEKLRSVLYSQHTKIFEAIKEHITNYLPNDGTKTRQDDGEIDCKVMNLIVLHNGLMMNKLLGVKEETNRRTWVDTTGRILGTCPKAE